MKQSVSPLTIPFNRPYIGPDTLPALERVLRSGRLSGDGPVCHEVEKSLRELTGARHALLTTSGTHALEMAMVLIGIRPGDEVILPSFTFVSTANAVLRAGGRPVFCEIDDRTLTMDPADVRRRITPRTRAIIPVHYAGVAADMDAIMSIAAEHECSVVEDAAQGVNARYRGRPLGTIGTAGALSFHDTKNYIAGEGGAFLTDDELLGRRGEIVREKGTNRANFIRGEVDKYTWVDDGSSYVLSDLLAAVLKCQLDAVGMIQKARRTLYEAYLAHLQDAARAELLSLPFIPDSCESNYHIMHVLLPTNAIRDNAIRCLKEKGIGATFHYIPLHSSPYARRVLGTEHLQLPVTDRVAGCLLRLPLYPDLTVENVGIVCDRLISILKE